MDLSKIKQATAAIEEGAWVPSSTFPGVRYRVRGASCAEAKRLRTKMVNAIPPAARVNGLSDADATMIDNRILADVIWLGVEGLTENGVAVSLTPEKSLALLENPDYALLKDDLRAAAMRVGDEQLLAQKEDEKN